MISLKGQRLSRLSIILGICLISLSLSENVTAEERPWIKIRGVYGGMPVLPEGKQLEDFGINAVWVGSGSITQKLAEQLHVQGVRLFAEFNTMHNASFLKDHPDARPVGIDGKVCPPPDGWQGVCPTHPEYRKDRMNQFRKTLETAEIDGIWLDYHHSHASWEQAVPNMPKTCFCERCVALFCESSNLEIPKTLTTAERNLWIWNSHRPQWVKWRCGVFTDWVREFRQIVDKTRPNVLLGTFHNPWSVEDYDGAILNLLAIDLRSQSRYLDVLSIMPYHARFGHANDPAWISRQTTWLSDYLSLPKDSSGKPEIWPIVQLADWGEPVLTSQIPEILDHATRKPTSGVTIFHVGGLNQNPDRIQALGNVYRSIMPAKRD